LFFIYGEETAVQTLVEALDPGDYEDVPEDRRLEVLSIYMAWDGAGGETWIYELSAENVVGECGPPPKPEPAPDGMEIFLDDELPGGRTLWFKGVSPGDVVIAFTTKNEKGKVVDIQQYAVRVYDDLRLALLHAEHNSYR